MKLNNVSKRFGGRTVIDGATFVVNSGEVAGIVGPYGSGKTTLLRIIAREERADSGTIDAAGRIAYVRQGFAPDATRTAGPGAAGVAPDRTGGSPGASARGGAGSGSARTSGALQRAHAWTEPRS